MDTDRDKEKKKKKENGIVIAQIYDNVFAFGASRTTENAEPGFLERTR